MDTNMTYRSSVLFTEFLAGNTVIRRYEADEEYDPCYIIHAQDVNPHEYVENSLAGWGDVDPVTAEYILREAGVLGSREPIGPRSPLLIGSLKVGDISNDRVFWASPEWVSGDLKIDADSWSAVAFFTADGTRLHKSHPVQHVVDGAEFAVTARRVQPDEGEAYYHHLYVSRRTEDGWKYAWGNQIPAPVGESIRRWAESLPGFPTATELQRLLDAWLSD